MIAWLTSQSMTIFVARSIDALVANNLIQTNCNLIFPLFLLLFFYYFFYLIFLGGLGRFVRGGVGLLIDQRLLLLAQQSRWWLQAKQLGCLSLEFRVPLDFLFVTLKLMRMKIELVNKNFESTNQNCWHRLIAAGERERLRETRWQALVATIVAILG